MIVSFIIYEKEGGGILFASPEVPATDFITESEASYGSHQISGIKWDTMDYAEFTVPVELADYRSGRYKYNPITLTISEVEQ